MFVSLVFRGHAIMSAKVVPFKSAINRTIWFFSVRLWYCLHLHRCLMPRTTIVSCLIVFVSIATFENKIPAFAFSAQRYDMTRRFHFRRYPTYLAQSGGKNVRLPFSSLH